MTSCFCFSLCKCSILFLPDWLFLLLAAHGRIWPPYQPKSYIPSKSCIQGRFSVSVFQIHICRKVNRYIGGSQVYTLGPMNPGHGPTWEPDFWEGERKSSLKRGLEMGCGGDNGFSLGQMASFWWHGGNEIPPTTSFWLLCPLCFCTLCQDKEVSDQSLSCNLSSHWA